MPTITITLRTDDGLHISVKKQQTERAVTCVYGALGELPAHHDCSDLHALAMHVHDGWPDGAKLTIEYNFE